MKSIRNNLNLGLVGVLGGLQIFLYVGYPTGYVSEFAGAVLIVLAVLLTPTLWALIHEGFHGSLLENSQANNLAMRMLCILMLAPAGPLRFGHLLHHRFNRSELDRSDVIEHRHTTTLLAYYWRLLGGLYLLELATTFITWFPVSVQRRLLDAAIGRGGVYATAVRAMADQQLFRFRALWQIRLDGTLCMFLFGAAMISYGSAWPILGIALAGRALLLALLDNVYHYGNSLNESLAADNLSLPAPLSRLYLHFNLHRVHHRYPGLPWHRLPVAFENNGDRYDGPLFRRAIAQLSGPRLLHELDSSSGRQ